MMPLVIAQHGGPMPRNSDLPLSAEAQRRELIPEGLESPQRILVGNGLTAVRTTLDVFRSTQP
jgi:hypothetical protein